MIKYLVVIGVIAFVYFMFIKKKPISSTKDSKDTKPQPNDMIECSSCGVYVEISESILSNGKYYCSKECVQKGN
ncbi:PP0621 family protein [Sulfurimonas sp.]|uniref:PP0621 family protein n=1 Tax=Sulfurimonas sp. TaxID=2022749 RepID=UPI003D0B68C3